MSTPEPVPVAPPSRFTDFRKLMHLARTTGDGSDFQCTTRAGKIIEWNDPRPQPTYEEIEAVDIAVAEAREKTDELDRLTSEHPDPVIQAILDSDPALKANVRATLAARQAVVSRAPT